jgi:hypothetical protein
MHLLFEQVEVILWNQQYARKITSRISPAAITENYTKDAPLFARFNSAFGPLASF